jgi:hypothetical protein
MARPRERNMIWKSIALVAVGILVGILATQTPAFVTDAEAGSGACWLETKNDAQKFEDGVNLKIAEGYKNVVGYQYEVYNSNGSVAEMYTVLQCK